jgi:DNA-directed RNA polymerase subunit F
MRKLAKPKVVKEKCEGCGWKKGTQCEVIISPVEAWEHGECFARASAERIAEVKRECTNYARNKEGKRIPQ